MAEREADNPTDSEQLSADAVPIASTSSTTSGETSASPAQDEQRTDASRNQGVRVQPMESLGHLPDPPTDWKLNVFLKKLSDSLSNEELQSMKYLFHGQGGIGRGLLDKMRSAQEFFRILRDRGYITRDNLLFLQAILYCAGRKDLVKEAVECSNSLGNVLHFYTPTEQPENGYKYVKVHIEGKDFSNYSREDLETLRSKIGDWLCVPTTFIFIRGIQPSSSLFITLMIPEMYADILHDLLKERKTCISLRDIGVDSIAVDGQSPNSIKDPHQGSATGPQTKQGVAYEHLEYLRAQREKIEESNIELLRQVDSLQTKLAASGESLERSKLEFEALEVIVSVSNEERRPASRQDLSAVTEFRESLNRINQQSIDRKVIKRMLNATVHILKEEQKILHDLQDNMVPVERLEEYQKGIEFLRKQNEECVQRLDQLESSMDLLVEPGYPETCTCLTKLEYLYRHSMLLTTILKILSRRSGQKLPKRNTSDVSREEFRQKSLCPKARIQRLYLHV